jgi:hypothetical protein
VNEAALLPLVDLRGTRLVGLFDRDQKLRWNCQGEESNSGAEIGDCPESGKGIGPGAREKGKEKKYEVIGRGTLNDSWIAPGGYKLECLPPFLSVWQNGKPKGSSDSKSQTAFRSGNRFSCSIIWQGAGARDLAVRGFNFDGHPFCET